MKTMKKYIFALIATMFLPLSMMAQDVANAFDAYNSNGDLVGSFATLDEAIEAGGNGCTVKMNQDAYGQQQINSQMTPVTFDLNGHTLYAEQAAGLNFSTGYYWNGEHVFTIKDGVGGGGINITPKYTGNACISDNTGRTIIVEGGTFTSTGKAVYCTASNATFTINGGTFNGDIYVHDTGYGHGELSITNGTFNGTLSTTGDAVLVVSGGIFSEPVPENYCASGMMPAVYDATSGTYTVNEPVAKIDNVNYGSLAEAFAAATDGQIITLLKDCAGNGIIVPQGKFTTGGLTVDFNGHTYTVDRDPLAGSAGTETQAFQLLKDNKITFKSSAADKGKIYSEVALMLVQNYSNLTLENMELTLNNTEYTNPAYTLSNNNGNVVIDGTTINANNANSFAFDVCRYSSYPSVNVTVTGNSTINGNVEIDASNSDPKDGFSLTLNSGTMNGDIIVTGKAATAMAAAPDKTEVTKNDNFNQAAPQGYVWKDNGNGTSSLAPAVAKIGTTTYASLADAVTDAAANDVITLIGDDYTSFANGDEVEINMPLTITGEVDTNGVPKWTLYGTSNNNGYNDLFIKSNTGTVTVSNVKFSGFGNAINSKMGHSPICVSGSNNDVVIDNVYISNINCEGIHVNGGTFTIQNCNIDCTRDPDDAYTDYTKGICIVNAATGSITGTTITGVDCNDPDDLSAGIELQGSGDITISGCNIETKTIGISATYVRVDGTPENDQPGTSTVNVSDCTIESTNYSFYGNGYGKEGDGAVINITSGTYTGKLSATLGNTKKGLLISGGKYSVRVPMDNIVDGKICPTEANEDGGTMWSLVTGSYVARIGDYGFESLDAAIAAVTDADEIILLNNITLSDNIVCPLTDGQGMLIAFGENGEFDITKGDYSVSLATGVTVTTNKQTNIFTVSTDGNLILETENSGTYEYKAVDPSSSTDVVAKIGNVGYATLAAAIAAVPTDGTKTTITMIANETVAANTSMTIAAGKNIVLDLNGKTITGSSTTASPNFYFITNKGTLEITDNTESASGKITYGCTAAAYSNEYVTICNEGGTFTLTKGTIENTSGGLSYAVNNRSVAPGTATFNLNGGTVSAPSGDAAVRVYQSVYNASSPYDNIVNVTGGTILDNGIFADSYIGDNVDGSNSHLTVNISGGTVNGLIDYKLRHPYNIALNITDGTFGNSKLWVRKYASEWKGSAEPTAPIVTISGGQFQFKDNMAFGLAYECGETSWTSYTKPYEVSGGIYNVNLNNFSGIQFPAGQIGIENTDPATAETYPYTVGLDAVATIGTNRYATLQEAFEAVQDGETIKLQKDVNLNSGGTGSADNNNFTCPLTSGTITIDYNGKNISASNRFINLHNGVTVVTNKTYVNGDERPLFFRAADASGAVVTSLVENKYKFTTLQQTSDVPYIDENEADQTAAYAIPLTADLGDVIMLDSRWYYPTADVTYQQLLFTLNETANIILTDGTKLTATKSIEGNNSTKGNLVIYGQSGKTGTLNLPRVGDMNITMLTYTQNSGSVTSAGAYNARAITINNGTLNVSSNGGGYPAIGRQPISGDFASSTVTIKKGIVNTTATGTNGNAIQTGTVDITGGQVTATGRNAGINAGRINIGLTENADLSPSEEFILVSKYTGPVYIYGTDNTLYDAETNVAYQGQPVTDNTTIDGRKLVVGLTVAVIGDKRFKTLKAAIDYITNDGNPRTIKIVNDFEQTEQLLIAESNKSITIDMNGHTITSPVYELFRVEGNNINLTFTGNGEVAIAADDDGNVVAMRGENGHLVVGPGVTLTEGTVFVRGKNNVIDINGTINVTGDQAAIQTNGNDTNTGNIINVNDPAFITSADLAIYAAGDANYNINGGTITGASGVYVKSGKLTVTDGTIAATGAQAPYTANNNGANATGDGIVVDNCNYPSGSPEVIIRGGTVTSENADPVASYARDGQPKITGFIYAGTYNKEFDASLLAQGYVLNPDGNGMYTPVPGAGVAKIGDVYYQTLDAALADVPTDGPATTIELLTNINATKRTVIPSNTNITLDLGGYTLRCDNDYTIAFFDGTPGNVGTNKTNNAQLTVKNGVVTSKKSYAIRTDGTGNTLTIAEDATVKAGNETDYAIVVRGTNNNVTVNGTVEVLSGTAISTNGDDTGNAITINEPAKITSPDDNAIYLPSGSLTVNGGTITGTTGIYFKSKNLVIPAGSTAVITGTGEQRAAHYNGNGGDWTGDALVVDNANYPSGDPLADIQGGTFVSANALPIASYATGSSATAATKFVSGGKFSAQIPTDVIVDGYICPSEPNEGSYYTLVPGSYVAEVEGLGYETFVKAVAAADGEKVITLLAEITPDYTMSEGQTLKVAKEGHNITVVAPAGFQVSETTETIDGKVVTIYTLPKNIVPLVPTAIRSDWTGEEQSAPLVIKDGNYTLVKGVDYKLQKKDEATGDYDDADDILKTDVGPVTFKVVGIGKYINETEVTWTIYKNISFYPISVEIDPVIYEAADIDPKDYVHVYDNYTNPRIELVYGTDYTIDAVTTVKDAKTYINSLTVRGKEQAEKWIGGELTFSISVLPYDIKDVTVSGNVQTWREAGYTPAQIADLIKLTTIDGNDLEKDVDYTITVADGTYKDVKTYENVITVTAKSSNYSGMMKLNFTIVPDGLIDISKCVVTSKTVYNSLAQQPAYSTIEVVYNNGSSKVVLDNAQFNIQINGMESGYVDAKTYSNAITLTGTTQVGTTNTLRFYGSVNADYVITPRDLADTNFADDNVEVVLQKNKDMVWTGSDLTQSIKIGDSSDTNNNLFLYMKVQNDHYVLINDDTNHKYDYSYTVSPSPMVAPGEYKVVFSGRGNFTGIREVKINVLKDISNVDIIVPLQVIPNNTSLTPSMLKDIEVKDGNQTLVPGVHYTIVIKNGAGSITYSETNPIKDDGIYQAIFEGKEPYYFNTATKNMSVLFEYNHFDANVDAQYYNGNTSGYQIVQPVSIHVTSGKNLECTVGDKNMPAVANNVTSATLPGEAKFTLGSETFTLKVVGIDNNAFDGAAGKMHYLDATALTDYAPSTLTRDFAGPFNGLPKQTLVFLCGTTFTGENYIYKCGTNDFRCDVLKIYDDVSGTQTSFTENEGFKWGFENPYEFKANTVTNTRQLNTSNAQGKQQGYTICLPYALPASSDFTAYTLAASKTDMLGFLPVTDNTLAAMKPYVLLPNASGQLLSTTNATVVKTVGVEPISVISQAVTGQTTYTMKGNMTYLTDKVGAYIMQNGNVWKKIQAAAEYGGPCILPMRAYIEASGTGTGAPQLMSVFGAEGTTGMDVLERVDLDAEDGQYFDLQGRPVETPTRGVYIRNGKKVVIK